MNKILSLLVVILCTTMQAQTVTQKRNFIYSYDGMGNRTARNYVLLTCPNCRLLNISVDSLNTDSLYDVAQGLNLQIDNQAVDKIKDEELQISLYPNPVQSNFVIAFNEYVLDGKVQLLTLDGALLTEQKISGREWQIDISLFPASIYQVIIQRGEKKYVKKLVKL